MDGVAPARSATAILLEEKEPLAWELTGRLYRALPGLMEKYGEYGRQKCLQDMRYTLEHLAPAVELQAPEMFAGYVRWLDDLLRARNVPTAEVVRTLELAEEVLGERMGEEQLAAVRPSLRAGLAVLRGAA